MAQYIIVLRYQLRYLGYILTDSEWAEWGNLAARPNFETAILDVCSVDQALGRSYRCFLDYTQILSKVCYKLIWKSYMLWCNFILGANFIFLCFWGMVTYDNV